MRMRDDGDQRAGIEAGKAWLRIKKSGQRNWADWTTAVGPFLVRLRSEAMLLAKTNKPKGRGYSETFSALLIEYRLDDIEQVARKDLFEIMQELVAVNRYRDGQRDPSKLNHPTTVWRQFKKSGDYKAALMARGEYTPPPAETPPREKPTLLEERAALRDQVRDLTGQLAEAIEERDAARNELERRGSTPAGEAEAMHDALEQTDGELEAARQQIEAQRARIAELEERISELEQELRRAAQPAAKATAKAAAKVLRLKWKNGAAVSDGRGPITGKYTAMLHTNEQGVTHHRAAYTDADGQLEVIQDGCGGAATAREFCQRHHEEGAITRHPASPPALNCRKPHGYWQNVC